MIELQKLGPCRYLAAVHGGGQQKTRTCRRARSDWLTQAGRSFQAIRPDRGVNGSHQQRGRNTLSAYVPHRQNKLLGIQGQEIVVVSAHCPGGTTEAENLERRHLRDVL